MPNNFFQFKQFTIHHDRCAMKVGTDGVLLGAWASVENARHIIDIGTGSGLIALMVAQRNPQATVLGIDINELAVSQAKENAQNSPFSDRIDIRNESVQEFVKNNSRIFDAVVSNPPFFADSLPSQQQARTIARHTDTLSLTALFASTARLLTAEGMFSLIYPIDRLSEIIDCAEQNALFLHRQTTVFPTPDARPKRVLLEFSKQPLSTSVLYNELVLEIERHCYSEAFRELTKGFYVKF